MPTVDKRAPASPSRSEPGLFALTDHGAHTGTRHDIAPELAFGASPEDPCTDLHSFGVLAYELVTGTSPYAFIVTDGVACGELAKLAPTPPSVDHSTRSDDRSPRSYVPRGTVPMV